MNNVPSYLSVFSNANISAHVLNTIAGMTMNMTFKLLSLTLISLKLTFIGFEFPTCNVQEQTIFHQIMNN